MNKLNYILPTACFPPISYFYYLFNANKIIIDLGENYIKQTYRNRYKICSYDGAQQLIIPIKNTHCKTPIQDIEISYTVNWQRLHFKTIETNYNKSPYYLYYKSDFFDFFFKKHRYLTDFNKEFLSFLFRISSQPLPDIEYSSYYINIQDFDNFIDLRNAFDPKISENIKFTKYTQVFSDRQNFISNLSILDALFNVGPDIIEVLQ